MGDIDLTLLNVATAGKISTREEPSRSDAKIEGGFAKALAGQEEMVETDSEINPSGSLRQDGKQSLKVEPEKDQESNAQSLVIVSDSKESDVEIEEEGILLEVPFQKVSPDETLTEVISLSQGMSSSEVISQSEVISPSEAVLSNEVTFPSQKASQVVEKENRDSRLFGLFENRADLSQKNVVSDHALAALEEEEVSGIRPQLLSDPAILKEQSTGEATSERLVKSKNDLLEGLRGLDQEVKVSHLIDGVAGESSDVAEGGYVDGQNLEVEEQQFLLSSSDVEIGNSSVEKLKVKDSNDPAFMEDVAREIKASSTSSGEPLSPFQSQVVVAEAESAEDIESVEAKVPSKASDTVVNVPYVKSEQISKPTNEINQEPPAIVADVVDLKVEGEGLRQIKNGLGSQLGNASSQTSISSGGNVVAEIPEGVQIHVNNELTVARSKPENSAVRSAQGARATSLTGDEMGIVHLQGRARENQSTLAQGDQHHGKDFSGFEADTGDGEQFSFSGISKKIFDEQTTLPSSLQSAHKEKQVSGHNVLKSDEMAAVHLETGKEILLKNSPNSVSAKPLPVSDENLMEQIKTGMARQAQGRQTVTIRLWPESMGKVDVKLVLREQQLSATFMVEQSDVKDAMLRKLDSLRDGLSLRGIDVKEIDIKVTPPKSGDGPSVTVGDQHQESADAWRQYRQGGFSQSDSDRAQSAGGEGRSDDSDLLPENLADGITLAMDQGSISGSLHIMA